MMNRVYTSLIQREINFIFKFPLFAMNMVSLLSYYKMRPQFNYRQPQIFIHHHLLLFNDSDYIIIIDLML